MFTVLIIYLFIYLCLHIINSFLIQSLTVHISKMELIPKNVYMYIYYSTLKWLCAKKISPASFSWCSYITIEIITNMHVKKRLCYFLVHLWFITNQECPVSLFFIYCFLLTQYIYKVCLFVCLCLFGINSTSTQIWSYRAKYY